MEKNKKKIQVFSIYRPLIKILSVYNKRDFHVTSFENSIKIVISIILFGTCLMMTLLVWHCFDHQFDVKKIAPAITMLIGSALALLLFVCLANKTYLISETIDLLQRIVEERNI